MASYNLVLDTKFKPFTYAEMLKPVAAATEAHQALETEYNDLAVKASVWEEMADEVEDPITYKMYKKYADDLKRQSDILATSGLNPLSRSGMLNMRRRYGEEIIPIEQAYKRRETLDKEESDALKRDETVRYRRRAKDISLDEFIKDPMLGHSESYSGRNLTNTVAGAVSSYVNAAINKGDLKSLGLPYQYTQDIQYGATPDQVNRAMNKLYNAAAEGEPEAVKWLLNIRDQAIYNTGVLDWEDNDSLAEAIRFANLGLTKAIGRTEIKNYTDQAGLASYEQSLRDAADYRKFAREHPELFGNDDGVKGLMAGIHDFYGESEVAKANEKDLQDLERFKTVWGSKDNQNIYSSPFDSPGVTGYSKFIGYLPSPDESSLGLTRFGITKKNYDKYTDWAKQRGITPMSEWEWVDYQVDYKIKERQGKTGIYATQYNSIDIKDENSEGVANRMRSQVGDEGNIQQITGLQQDAKGNVSLETSSVSSLNFAAIVKSNPIVQIGNLSRTGEQFVVLANGDKYKIPPGTFDTMVETGLADANSKIRDAASEEEKFTEMNRVNSYLQTILNYNAGTKLNYGDPIVSTNPN